jgi:hypothetical protein
MNLRAGGIFFKNLRGAYYYNSTFKKIKQENESKK